MKHYLQEKHFYLQFSVFNFYGVYEVMKTLKHLMDGI